MTRGNKILLSAIIGGSALAYLIYRKLQKDSLYDEILKKIGIGESFGQSSIWLPTFLIQIDNQGRPVRKLNAQQMNRYATQLFEAIDGWGTTETAIFEVFRSVESKYQLSQIAKYYGQKYSASLKTDLEEDLGEKEMQEISNIILSKPNAIYITQNENE